MLILPLKMGLPQMQLAPDASCCIVMEQRITLRWGHSIVTFPIGDRLHVSVFCLQTVFCIQYRNVLTIYTALIQLVIRANVFFYYKALNIDGE